MRIADHLTVRIFCIIALRPNRREFKKKREPPLNNSAHRRAVRTLAPPSCPSESPDAAVNERYGGLCGMERWNEAPRNFEKRIPDWRRREHSRY